MVKLSDRKFALTILCKIRGTAGEGVELESIQVLANVFLGGMGGMHEYLIHVQNVQERVEWKALDYIYLGVHKYRWCWENDSRDIYPGGKTE